MPATFFFLGRRLFQSTSEGRGAKETWLQQSDFLQLIGRFEISDLT